ncbi:MAG: phospholipid carrier-dependent glycosyltransferase [Acidobacteria bacterium]|nr:phospholipid carrier-dependent glycosyltransferase [Acidobacteriota bacterium]
MSRREMLRWAVFAIAAWFLLFSGVGLRGVVGPDEPRYASIAREMWLSGDWVTPRLGGEPWFEKPALLYWLGAAGMALGAPADQATRLATAALSVLFLVFYHWRLRRVFDETTADVSTAILLTTAGWAAFGQAGVFDLPLTAAVGAALLLLLEWADDPADKRRLPWFGALLGVSVLAKGLAGPAVATMAALGVCTLRGVRPVARDLFAARTLLPFLAVCGPWYAICYARNGDAFVEEFLWRHHVLRLISPELQHVQPAWFYLPVLAGALLPWAPLALGLPWRRLWEDPRTRLLLAWALGTLLFFSLSTNKLPGYILPALPAFAALMGLRLRVEPLPRRELTAAALLLGLLPLAAAVLPEALASGLPSAWPPKGLSWGLAGPFAAAVALVSWAAWTGRRELAVWALAAAAAAGLTQLKLSVYPQLDAAAGIPRELQRELAAEGDRICVGDVRRHVAYGAELYSLGRAPACADQDRPLRLEGDPPKIVR